MKTKLDKSLAAINLVRPNYSSEKLISAKKKTDESWEDLSDSYNLENNKTAVKTLEHQSIKKPPLKPQMKTTPNSWLNKSSEVGSSAKKLEIMNLKNEIRQLDQELKPREHLSTNEKIKKC